MDARVAPDRGRLERELKLAIQNVNRNLYEWKNRRANSMLTITYDEIQGLLKNWIIRALKNVMDSYKINRMFSRIRVMSGIHDDYWISSVYLSDSWSRNADPDFAIIQDILHNMDLKKLKYDPSDYQLDGVSQRNDEFYYKPIEIEPVSSLLDKFKYETPKT